MPSKIQQEAIRQSEITRSARHIEGVDDPAHFNSWPPFVEIPLAQAALSRLFHESNIANDKQRADFAMDGLLILEARAKGLGLVATRDS